MGVLQTKIAGFLQELATKASAEDLQVMGDATAELVATGIDKSALGLGDVIPEFSLPNAKGDMVNIKDVLAEGPVVLTFYRGGWCPFCNLQLQEYQDHLDEITAQGAKLVAVAPESPSHVESTTKAHDLTFDVLSDDKNKTAKEFGLVFELAEAVRPVYAKFGIDVPAHNGDASYELPVPATYVVNQEGVITWAMVDADYTKRAEIEDILKAL